MSERRPITEIVADLESESKRLNQCERDENHARAITADSRNTVNRLQKELDSAMETLREKAAVQTDWHSQRQKGKVA